MIFQMNFKILIKDLLAPNITKKKIKNKKKKKVFKIHKSKIRNQK